MKFRKKDTIPRKSVLPLPVALLGVRLGENQLSLLFSPDFAGLLFRKLCGRDMRSHRPQINISLRSTSDSLFLVPLELPLAHMDVLQNLSLSLLSYRGISNMRSISSGLVQGPSVIGTTLHRYEVPSGVGYTHTIHPGSQRPFWVYSQDLKEAANNERKRKIHPIYSKCRQSRRGNISETVTRFRARRSIQNRVVPPGLGINRTLDDQGLTDSFTTFFFFIFATSTLILSLSTGET